MATISHAGIITLKAAAMKSHNFSHFHLFLLLFCFCGWLGLFRLAEAEVGHHAEPEITLKVSANQNATGGGEKSYTVSVRAGGSGEVAQIILWWATPEGKTTSIDIKPVDTGAWASPVAMDSVSGRQKLTLLVIGRNAKQGVGSIRQLLYSLELPEIKLKKEGEQSFAAAGEVAAKDPSKPDSGPDAETAPSSLSDSPDTEIPAEPEKKFSLSTPVIVLLGFMLVLGLSLLGVVGVVIYRRLPARLRKRTELKNQMKSAQGDNEPVEKDKIAAAFEEIEKMKQKPAAGAAENLSATIIEDSSPEPPAAAEPEPPKPATPPQSTYQGEISEEELAAMMNLVKSDAQSSAVPSPPPAPSAPAAAEEDQEEPNSFQGAISEEELVAMFNSAKGNPKNSSTPSPPPEPPTPVAPSAANQEQNSFQGEISEEELMAMMQKATKKGGAENPPARPETPPRPAEKPLPEPIISSAVADDDLKLDLKDLSF